MKNTPSFNFMPITKIFIWWHFSKTALINERTTWYLILIDEYLNDMNTESEAIHLWCVYLHGQCGGVQVAETAVRLLHGRQAERRRRDEALQVSVSVLLGDTPKRQHHHGQCVWKSYFIILIVDLRPSLLLSMNKCECIHQNGKMLGQAKKNTERTFGWQIKSSVTGGRAARGSPGECLVVSLATSKSLLMCLLRAWLPELHTARVTNANSKSDSGSWRSSRPAKQCETFQLAQQRIYTKQ